jgi:hypothetical protein
MLLAVSLTELVIFAVAGLLVLVVVVAIAAYLLAGRATRYSLRVPWEDEESERRDEYAKRLDAEKPPPRAQATDAEPPAQAADAQPPAPGTPIGSPTATPPPHSPAPSRATGKPRPLFEVARRAPAPSLRRRFRLFRWARLDAPMGWSGMDAGLLREPPGRYANVRVLNPQGKPIRGIAPGELARLRVDIGALQQESLVERPVAFPDDLLPSEDVTLEVLLSSSDFAVGTSVEKLRKASVARQALRLPAEGGAAVSEDGKREYVDFALRAPERMERARARLSYVYRNTVVQSQRVDAILGLNVRVTTDFTLSRSLAAADVQAISERPRVALIANDSPGDYHELTVRAGDAGGAPVGDPVTFKIEHQRIGPAVAQLRRQLARQAPRRRRQSPSELVKAMRELAPLGHKLYAALDPRLQATVRDVARTMPEAVLQVALAHGSTFTLPWSFVYDIYLPSDVPAKQLKVCRVLSEWDGNSPMVAAGQRACPHADDDSHREAVLCPFGFWGYRYSIELLTSTDRPAREIRCETDSKVVMGETERGLRRGGLTGHAQALATILANATPTLSMTRTQTVAGLRSLIEDDLPIIYLLCHGKRAGTQTLLSIGKRQRISAQDLIGWMDVAARKGRRMWTDPRPLVFVNACGSAQITPEDLVDYLGAFVGKGQAAGLIGTEVKVEQGQAMQLAESFFARLFEHGASVEQALHHVRSEFLASGNLFGLVYTPYCLADLAVAIPLPAQEQVAIETSR